MPFRCFSDWLLWDVTANISCLSVLSGAAEIKTSPECPRVAKDWVIYIFLNVLILPFVLQCNDLKWWFRTMFWCCYDAIFIFIYRVAFATKNVLTYPGTWRSSSPGRVWWTRWRRRLTGTEALGLADVGPGPWGPASTVWSSGGCRGLLPRWISLLLLCPVGHKGS